jgi:hypothetical protein
VKKSLKKPDLIYHSERLERKLICYADCKLDQLRTFAKDRGIVQLSVDSKSRNELTRMLMTADDGLKFERFLDLPAELRSSVYE